MHTAARVLQLRGSRTDLSEPAPGLPRRTPRRKADARALQPGAPRPQDSRPRPRGVVSSWPRGSPVALVIPEEAFYWKNFRPTQRWAIASGTSPDPSPTYSHPVGTFYPKSTSLTFPHRSEMWTGPGHHLCPSAHARSGGQFTYWGGPRAGTRPQKTRSSASAPSRQD